MNFKKLVLAAILPVPLFCLGSATYAFPNLLLHPVEFTTLAGLWLGYGFLIMGIPSVIYSFAIEALRTKMNASLTVRSICGATLGFLSGSVCFILSTEPTILYTIALPGAVIGSIIPAISAIIKESEQVGDGDAEEAV